MLDLQSGSIEASRSQPYTTDNQAYSIAVDIDSGEGTQEKRTRTESEEREPLYDGEIVDLPPSYEIPVDLDEKKHRGEAAPPGGCHKCHSAETQQWRLGPHGARTLCDRCGLRESLVDLTALTFAKAI